MLREDSGRLSPLPLRYPDDKFDRIWKTVIEEGSLYGNTTGKILTTDLFEIPSSVLQTALVTLNKTQGYIGRTWNIPEIGEYYIVMCFAEVENLTPNAIREFNINIDGYTWATDKLDAYPDSLVTHGPKNFSSLGKVEFSLDPTKRSTEGAILNAWEIYRYSSPLNNGTYAEDVNALADIARHFNLEKEWMGDPCLPQKYSWDWVDCNQDSSPRIIAVTLTNMHLNGTIPQSFANLSALVKLDLARNNLSSSIPEALATLSNLNELNLTDNDLNGSVPNGLSEKKQRVATLITITAILMFIKYKSSKKIPKGKTKTGHLDLVKLDGCRSFSYEEVIVMTSNFQREIGKGGYGPVYLGCFQGKDVAVKILSDKSHQGAMEFSTEVDILSKLHHKNLVKFMGYCTEEQKLVLIYEYMSNGDLRHCLDGQTSSRNTLEWERRLNIALDAAQGLEYLHVGCKPGIIHRDIKSSNILLNDQMEAKIADFGLSKLGPLEGATHVSTLVKGTTGYLDPEYYTAHRLTEKSDVYSFGVVLMEIISGRRPHFVDPSTSTSEQIHIASWVMASIVKGDIENIVDPILLQNYNKDGMWKVAELAMNCTSPYSMNRPSMNEVVLELKEASRYQTHYYQNVEFHEFSSPQPLLSSRRCSNVDSSASLYPLPR
ncbi:hypothetical protein SUGI_0949140 [Cryptomeria japonica]|nr:hypothetical protein SUGI_0949140 [Cryptomeria japonica]